MNSNLEKRLANNFPSLLGDYFHIECDDGWYEIIYNLCSEIKTYETSQISNSEYIPVKATQIKEKFGGLVFYYSGGDDYIFDLVSKYYRLSFSTCEYTGGHGSLHRDGYWLKTLSTFSAILLGFKK